MVIVDSVAVGNKIPQDTRLQHGKCIFHFMGPLDFSASWLSCSDAVCLISRTASPRNTEVLSSAGTTQPVSLYYPSVMRFYQALASAPSVALLSSADILPRQASVSGLWPVEMCYCLTVWTSASAKSLTRCKCKTLTSVALFDFWPRGGRQIPIQVVSQP